MRHGFDVYGCAGPAVHEHGHESIVDPADRCPVCVVVSVTRSIVDRIGSYSYLCVQTRLNIIRGYLLSGVDYRYTVRYTGDPQKKRRKMM